VLVLCHAFHRNYGVWLLDCLPFLLPWRGPLRAGRLAVLVPPLTDWQWRTLELLGVPASAVIVAVELSVLCDDMIVPGLNSLDVEPATEAVEPVIDPATEPRSYDLRQPGPAVIEAIQILRNGICSTAATDRPEYVYISRRGTDSFRHLSNEDEVEAVMMRLGFVVVRTEDLSFDEQVATFARARVIAGPHGAGLNNAAFAPAGCLVLDICADSWPNSWFVRLTQLFEHNYLPVEFRSDATLAQPIFLGKAIIGQSHSYTVQIDKLIAALESAMRTLGMKLSGNRV
jgi:capsular polysaccharide biosynthesis protein